MENFFDLSFLNNIKILIVAILIYLIIFGLLKKIQFFSDDLKVNSLIAFLSAIIVSFSGVVTYAISYAINLFVIIFFIVFLIILFLLFFGVNMDEISKIFTNNIKIISIILGIFFIIILFKSFFALNNTYDLNSNQNDSYNIDSSANFGVDDMTNKELEKDSIFDFFNGINKEYLSVGLFFLILGIFVFFIGK